MSTTAPRVCISLCERDWPSFTEAARRAAKYDTAIEFRVDCLQGDQLNELAPLRQILNETKQRTILTLRGREEGGKSKLDAGARFEFWVNHGLSLPASYCDLELEIVERLLDTEVTVDWSRIICSHHDFSDRPADVAELFSQLAATPAFVLKLAVRAINVTDTLSLFRLLHGFNTSNRKLIAIAMGEAGQVTRILGPSHGSFLTYAAPDAGAATADGQPTIDELTSLYRINDIDEETSITGIVGLPVAHSISPQIHNAAFADAGENAVYIPFAVQDARTFLAKMVHPRTRELEWRLRGLSVTAPHKADVIDQLDWLDPVAREIGAVNTIVVDEQRLCGYNTDAAAFFSPLKNRLGSLSGLRVALLGAGGAAKAAVYALVQEAAKVTVFVRDPRRFDMPADRWSIAVSELDAATFADFDVVVNATPLGMKGAQETRTPVRADQLRGAGLAYDIVYNPIETKFLTEARAAGCETLGGLEMFLAQAMKQFELWTGKNPNAEVMRNAAMRALSDI